ncbi:MAG: SDR family NAD(P)-dependent oxidoreductase [Bacteroidota bacterium]|nr:SDR family NAD(P)-dependent oxidoreductase [Bacteroidota bacterium]
MGKKILTIVGMGPGISNSVAEKFAKEGFAITMIARNEQRLKEYKSTFDKQGIDSFYVAADAGEEKSLITAFKNIHTNFGDTGVLLYNVFSFREGKPMDLKYEDVIIDFKVNVAGALLSAQQVLPAMLNKKEGTLLFTGGGLAIEPFPIYASLAIGKAGIRNFTHSLYADLKPKNIHAATVIVTGFVKPDTKFAPELIADEFWKLYLQKPGQFQREIIV